MSAAIKYDQYELAPKPKTSRDRRRHLQLVVGELQRRQPPSDLQPKQLTAYKSEATEILFGGAAYGGKSHLFRRAAIKWCQLIPGLQVYFFRREFGDLYKNHMEGPTGFPVMLADETEKKRARIVYGDHKIRFRNGPKGTEEGGSIIHLCHCQHEKDVQGYQGAEIHVLIIDELTQWIRSMYTFLRSRVRLGALKIPKWLKRLFPRILLGANPGGIGHTWVKAAFIDVAPPLTITKMAKAEGGMRRQFIPAKLEDNPVGVENDPEYEDRLEGLSDKQLAKAMRHGDWDIVAGGFFDDIWNRQVHVVTPFQIPSCWKVDRTHDWGSSKPYSTCWWAESDGTTAPNGITYPAGTVFIIAEDYGWNGTANEGCKMLSADVGRRVIEAERQFREWLVPSPIPIMPGAADSMIYDVNDGNCIADNMEDVGVYWVPAHKGPGSRKNGWELIRQMLFNAIPKLDASDKVLPLESPGLFAFDTCVHFIRTVPVLPRDPRNPDDVDTKSEDHIGDATRYRLLDAPLPPPQTFSHRV